MKNALSQNGPAGIPNGSPSEKKYQDKKSSFKSLACASYVDLKLNEMLKLLF